MQRRRPAVRAESAHAAVGRHEIQRRLGLHQVVNAKDFAEMGQIGAAAHADVLASIDEFARYAVVKGAGSPTEPAARIEQRDAKAARRQRRRRRQPRQTAADDEHAGLHLTLPKRGSISYTHPKRTGRTANANSSFFQRGTRTWPRNTS